MRLSVAVVLLFLIAGTTLLALASQHSQAQEKTCNDPVICPDIKVKCAGGEHSIYNWQRGDGVCDCCDGSDEPAGVCQDTCLADDLNKKRLKLNVEIDRLMGRRRKRLMLADNCFIYKSILDELAKTRNANQAILKYNALVDEAMGECKLKRQANIKQQHDLQSDHNKTIWAKLPECFGYKTSKFNYTICPFKNITQSDSTSTNVLGYYNPDTSSSDNTTMRFDRGTYCWQRRGSRTAKLSLSCGNTPGEITMFEEEEKCVYAFEMKTLAVC